MTSVPACEIRSRLTRLRTAMAKARIGGYYTTDEKDVHYLSGFTGSESALLITARKNWIVTDSRYTEEAELTAQGFEVLQWKNSFAEFMGKLARKARIGSMGFSPDQVTVATHKSLKKSAYGVRLKAVEKLVSNLRVIKSPWEIRQIQAALACAEESFRAVRPRIKPGMTEIDLKLDLELEMRRNGAACAAFDTIVAAGANASKPHAHAGTRKIPENGLVLIDFGARVGYYNSDLTRVVFMGTPPTIWQKRYKLVLQAQEQGIAAVRPGLHGREVDAVARKVFADAGCADHFGHGLGHGVGLAVHELPSLGHRGRMLLEPGMVVTIEPGLYYPRRGGIRIEDMVLVTKTGGRCLSALEK